VDVERTINFILESQAKAEIRQEKYEIRQEKYEIRQAKAEARVDAVEKRLDKRMDAIAKLLQQGMRMLVTHKAETDRKINALVDAQMRSEARLERLDTKMEELAEAQKDTQKTLKAFIASLQKGRNGH
jgi:chromosome segregation ATPase